MLPSIPLLMFILLFAVTVMQEIGNVLHLYNFYLIGHAAIVLAASIRFSPGTNDV